MQRPESYQPIHWLATSLNNRGYLITSATRELDSQVPAMKITTPDGELELYIFETDYFADPVRTVSFIVLNLDHAGYDLMGTCVDLKAAGFEVTLIADGLEERGVDVSALRRT